MHIYIHSYHLFTSRAHHSQSFDCIHNSSCKKNSSCKRKIEDSSVIPKWRDEALLAKKWMPILSTVQIGICTGILRVAEYMNPSQVSVSPQLSPMHFTDLKGYNINVVELHQIWNCSSS